MVDDLLPEGLPGDLAARELSRASYMLCGTRGRSPVYALPSNGGPESSSESMPCSPAAIIAASAR